MLKLVHCSACFVIAHILEVHGFLFVAGAARACFIVYYSIYQKQQLNFTQVSVLLRTYQSAREAFGICSLSKLIAEHHNQAARLELGYVIFFHGSTHLPSLSMGQNLLSVIIVTCCVCACLPVCLSVARRFDLTSLN